MRKFLAGLVILFILGLLLVWGLNQLFNAASEQTYAEAAREEAYGRAEAMIIHAQAESRLSAAQAVAATSAAMLPWGVLGVLGLLGLAVVALALVLALRQPAGTAGRSSLPSPIIVYLPAPDQPRRQVWQVLSRPDQLLSGKKHRPLVIESQNHK
jgi:hypothetical protein